MNTLAKLEKKIQCEDQLCQLHLIGYLVMLNGGISSVSIPVVSILSTTLLLPLFLCCLFVFSFFKDFLITCLDLDRLVNIIQMKTFHIDFRRIKVRTF